MDINVTNIIKEYGAYYINSGQNMQRLRRLLLFGRETVKYATHIKTNDTVFRLAESQMTSVVQPFQKTWTPKGDFKFTPNPIPLFHAKVDVDIYPDDIVATWLGFLEGNGLSRKEWPLIRYIMEEHLIKQIENDMELKAYYKGVYEAPISGTAGATENTMDGLKTFFQSDKVSRLTMDPLETTTIYDQLEEAFEQISEEYQNIPMITGVAPKWRRAFLKDKRAMGHYQITSPGQIDDTLDFAPVQVVGLPSMINTDDLWITPRNNFLHVTKNMNNSKIFKVEESKRCVSILTDWWEGLGFGINELVWTNVPESETEPEPEP